MSSMVALHTVPVDHLSFYPASDAQIQRVAHSQSTLGRRSSEDWFRGGLPTPPTTKDMTGMPGQISNGYYSQQHPYPREHRTSISSQTSEARPVSYFPKVQTNVHAQDGNSHHGQESFEKELGSQIASYLQLPESVSNSKGSLAEFAAEVTCLFWFETSKTIQYAESLHPLAIPDRGLNADATPSIGFRKWVTTILSTTQVGKNVVLLALMFIYRLKKFNPGVSGKRGSEFRLLTIALMLGNKFLDDNTYTNKTWAEVSGISVNEIHIMEVEFLSNMRYELYASEGEWLEWLDKLKKFGTFYERALRYRSGQSTSPTTPVTQIIPHKLPSPPSGNHYLNTAASNLPNPLHTLPHLPRSPAKYLSGVDYTNGRKRSLDTSNELPPSKRMHPSLPAVHNSSPVVLPPNSASIPYSGPSTPSFDGSRTGPLRLPNLPHPAGRSSLDLTPLFLPAPRAMSTVYPVTTSFSQPITPLSTHLPMAPQIDINGNLPHPPASGPVSRAPSHAGSAHTSPTNAYGASTPTRNGLSPSYFLMNRASPYRPVHRVNTLLYPPPSAAMQMPVRNVGFEQIHYQTLSKNSNQLYTGPMPSVHQDMWQNHTPTPMPQSYQSY